MSPQGISGERVGREREKKAEREESGERKQEKGQAHMQGECTCDALETQSFITNSLSFLPSFLSLPTYPQIHIYMSNKLAYIH